MENTTERLIQAMKALADPARLRIVALCRAGECSVSELTSVLAQSQPRVSQHLKQLCDAGLLERFRDGHFVYYRVALRGDASLRALTKLLPGDEPRFDDDLSKLLALRGESLNPTAEIADRPLNRALLELTVQAPLGELIDIGSGQGRVLKLLASRARRAVGVDIDPDARRFARAELLLAGIPNCTLRKGSMYALPFGDDEFDTVIIDDVLDGAEEPAAVLAEAARLVRPGGRVLILAAADDGSVAGQSRRFAGWCATTGLRLAQPKPVPSSHPRWLLAVATPNAGATAAA